MSWDYSETYIARCGQALSSYRAGLAHEADCPECLRLIYPHLFEEPDNDDDNEYDE